MVAQGVLPFRYEKEPTASGMTALAGLPPYLELAVASGLTDSIRRHLRVCSGQKQGWADTQIVMSLVLLNVAGGDCVDDLRLLEKDDGFTRVLRRVEMHGFRRKERREQERRWRKERKRAVPSPSAVFRYLAVFDNPGEELTKIHHLMKNFRGLGSLAVQEPVKAILRGHQRSCFSVSRAIKVAGSVASPQKGHAFLFGGCQATTSWVIGLLSSGVRTAQ